MLKKDYAKQQLIPCTTHSKVLYYLFPFNLVPDINSLKTIVIWGGGIVGRSYIQQLNAINFKGRIVCVDRKWKSLQQQRNYPVIAPNFVLDHDFDLIVIAALPRFIKSIAQDIEKLGIPQSKVIVGRSEVDLQGYFVESSTSPFGRLSFSGHAVDLLVLFTFKALGMNKFSYLDIGANDPYVRSNTALMYMHGNRGINIEANPKLILALERERPEDVTLNVGVGLMPGTMPFYVIDEDSGLSTFSKEYADARQTEGHIISQIIDVSVKRLDDVVAEYANDVYPDYLDIDIEGLDFEVLRSCNFSEDTPRIVSCEVKDDHQLNETTEMMAEKGYELFAVLGDDVIFLRKGLRVKLRVS